MIEVMHFWQDYHRNDVHCVLLKTSNQEVHSISWLIYLISGVVYLDHSVKLVSARSLQSKFTTFPFAIDKYLGQDTLKCANPVFPQNFGH